MTAAKDAMFNFKPSDLKIQLQVAVDVLVASFARTFFGEDEEGLVESGKGMCQMSFNEMKVTETGQQTAV
jgi:hypothetical protein